MSILILGGTAEARALAQQLTDLGLPVLSSLAGRVSSPALPAGRVRIGGFGGAAGLTDFLLTEHVTAVVDATHPFATQMSRHAAEAAGAAGRPLLRLARAGWSDHPGARSWSWVPDLEAAVAATDGERPFLTTGRQALATFLPWRDRDVVVRVVEPPDRPLPARWTLIRSRGPYRVDAERQLMLRHRVDVLVTKDSGGTHTRAKLDAAIELGVPVVVVTRPPSPPGVPTVSSVTDVVAWLSRHRFTGGSSRT